MWIKQRYSFFPDAVCADTYNNSCSTYYISNRTILFADITVLLITSPVSIQLSHVL